MARSVWKGSTLTCNKKQVWFRSQEILSRDIGERVTVYNGKSFTEVRVSEGMVGLKYGEFAITRYMGVGIHTDKKRKKK